MNIVFNTKTKNTIACGIVMKKVLDHFLSITERRSGSYKFDSEVLNGCRLDLKNLVLRSEKDSFFEQEESLKVVEILPSGYNLELASSIGIDITLDEVLEEVSSSKRKRNIAKAYQLMLG